MKLCLTHAAVRSLQSAVQHLKASDLAADDERKLLTQLCAHFCSRNAGVTKAALEVFVQLHRKRVLDVGQLLVDAEKQDGKAPFDNLVALLGHADLDIQQRTLTVINAVIKTCGTDICAFALCALP